MRQKAAARSSIDRGARPVIGRLWTPSIFRRTSTIRLARRRFPRTQQPSSSSTRPTSCRWNSLEQVRSVLRQRRHGHDPDRGMPGIPRSALLAFLSFTRASASFMSFGRSGAAEVQELLERCWTPPGVTLPDSGFTPEVVARLVRMTGGNLRLLTRLLTQVERVLGVNNTQVISVGIVEAARDSLVIGQA